MTHPQHEGRREWRVEWRRGGGERPCENNTGLRATYPAIARRGDRKDAIGDQPKRHDG
jgi:hypothetical protein